MPLHLLGVSRRADVEHDGIPAPRGELADVRWVMEGQLAAAVSPPSGTGSAGDPQSLAKPVPHGTQAGPLRHAARLTAIHRRFDVLPMRFGTLLDDESAVREFLGRRQTTLLDELLRLQGCGELGLRVQLPPVESAGPIAPPSRAAAGDLSPSQYLAARRAAYRQHDQWDARSELATAACTRVVHGLYRTWRRLSPAPVGTLRLAFLVPRALCGPCADRLLQWQREETGQEDAVLGPWPPYSFV